MAVVQISRIQLRRGKKKEGTGMPQLASGELAWAIDTQELYIGNGSVGEGAPFVGNTKIITENDSVLEIAAQYQYKFDSEINDSSLQGTIKRSIQSRLDDGIVNSKSFGVYPNIITDQTSAFQLAINEVASKTKVTLELDAGEYRFDSSINLPSNAKIKGQGKDNTILYFTSLGNCFVSLLNSEKINLSNLTIKISNNNSSLLILNNSRKCVFDDLKLVFNDGTAIIAGTPSSNRIGVNLIGSSLNLSNNIFSNIEFSRLTYGIFSNSGGSYNIFDKCSFNNLYKGAVLGSSNLESNYNTISNSIFDEVTGEGIEIINGYGNKSALNKFKNVGASQQGQSSTTNVIKFHTEGNSSIDDYFERQNFSTVNSYLPEIAGVSFYQKNNPSEIVLDYSTSFDTAIVMPLNTYSGMKIDYIVHSLVYNASRRGTMHIIANKNSGEFEISDEYEIIGEIEDFITFNGMIENQFGSVVLKIKYKNSELFVNDKNKLTYTYSILN